MLHKNIKVGEGQLGDGELLIPEEMRAETANLSDLVDAVFPSIATKFKDASWVGKRAILSPSNKEVQEVNTAVLKRLPGEEVVLKSIDTTEEGAADYPPEFLNTCELSGMPPHYLALKPGCLVMLLRNIDQAGGHCNGTKYVVVNIKPYVLELRSVETFNRGATILLPRIVSISKTKSLPFTLRRKQFAVKLAYGMTGNKAQGQTFDMVGLYMGRDFFSHGQTYVALSRAGHPACIKVFLCTHLLLMMKNVIIGVEATWAWRQGEASDYEECGLPSCLGVRGSQN